MSMKRRRAPPVPSSAITQVADGPLFHSSKKEAAINNDQVNPEITNMAKSPINIIESSLPTAPQDLWYQTDTICHPGLLWLMPHDRIIIKQPEGIYNMLNDDKCYEVLDSEYNPIYSVFEDSTYLERHCLGRQRSCEFRVCDIYMKEVFRASRALKCDSCCCPCCLQEITVISNGVLLGRVVQKWNPFRQSFSLRNETHTTQLKIKGPVLWCNLQNVYQVKSANEYYSVGRIFRKKKFSGARNIENQCEFEISFPQNLTCQMKAVIMSSCFLIDIMNYNRTSRIYEYNV